MSSADEGAGEEHECPWEGCNYTSGSGHGVKTHHAQTHGESIAGVEVVCENCGMKFRKRASAADGTNFCTQDCYTEWMQDNALSGSEHHRHKDKPVVKCEVCGDDFEITPAREDTARFCSMDCKGEWQSEAFSGPDGLLSQGKRVAVTCERCGETFKVKPSHADRRRFCSMDCKGEWQSEAFSGPDGLLSQGKTLSFTCEQCGETYKEFLNRADRTRFCSKKCMYNWRKEQFAGEDHPMWNGGPVESICVQCGDSFTDDPSASRRFCSRSCYHDWRKGQFDGDDHPMWNGGHEDYYGPNWIAQREKARERDGHQCVICGLSDEDHIERHGCELHVHHIRRFASFAPFDRVEDYERANDLSNLITLCLPCHTNAESMAPLLPQPGD